MDELDDWLDERLLAAGGELIDINGRADAAGNGDDERDDGNHERACRERKNAVKILPLAAGDPVFAGEEGGDGREQGDGDVVLPIVDFRRGFLEVGDEEGPGVARHFEQARGLGLGEGGGELADDAGGGLLECGVGFDAVRAAFQQDLDGAFDVGFISEGGVGLGGEFLAFGGVFGAGGGGEEGIAVLFEDVGVLDLFLGGGDGFGHFRDQRAEVRAGGFEGVDGGAHGQQRLRLFLLGGGEFLGERGDEGGVFGGFNSAGADGFDQIAALVCREVRGGGQRGEGFEFLFVEVGLEGGEHLRVGGNLGLGVAEDEIAGGAGLVGVSVEKRAGFLRAAHLGGAFAVDFGVIRAVEHAGELLVGAEIFPREIDEFETGDAINLQFALVAGEESEAFLEQENDDEREDDDGQPGVGGEEELDRLFAGEAPFLETVGRFSRWTVCLRHGCWPPW